MTLILSKPEIPGLQTLPDPGEALCFGDRKIWVQILHLLLTCSVTLGLSEPQFPQV